MPRKHHPLLASLGCAAEPSLYADLKALHALSSALSKPGGLTTVGKAASRALLLSSYAAVEASIGGSSTNASSTEEVISVVTKANGEVAAASRDVRAAFSTQPLLWGGDAVGFRTSDTCLCGAPASASALSRADPVSLFPEVSRLLTTVLRLPQATPGICFDALKALAVKADDSWPSISRPSLSLSLPT